VKRKTYLKKRKEQRKTKKKSRTDIWKKKVHKDVEHLIFWCSRLPSSFLILVPWTVHRLVPWRTPGGESEKGGQPK